jgi:hypothetical protein
MTPSTIDTEKLSQILACEALTESQRVAVEAVLEHGSYRAAARALGIGNPAVLRSVRRAGDVAARASLGNAAPPMGFSPVRVASDGQGRVKSVTSRREPGEPDARVDPIPEGHAVKGVSTYFGADGSVTGQWVKTDRTAQDRWQLFLDAAARATETYRGLTEPTPAPAPVDTDLEVLYPLGDPHIGMLAWRRETNEDFDLKIAQQTLFDTVDLLVERAPAADRGVLVNVGDFFHADDDTQTTPASGHKLDVDCRASKVTEIGFGLMRRMVDRLLAKHRHVKVINVCGNHDPRMSRMMAMWLSAVYEREPRVEVVPSENPFVYHRFGVNLIGVCHGDGAKPDALGAIMAADQPRWWGETEFRMWLTGHIHHLTRKEFPGNVVVESFRTMASRDYWHHWKGYRAGRSLNAIVLHRENGEAARFTVGLKEISTPATAAP